MSDIGLLSTCQLLTFSLSRGGVRSIVQLTILKELERSIGLGVNIVDFFDLIIGTSGGGIVAAGLGIRKFGVQKCIDKFQQVSKQAFTKRTGAGGVFGPFIEAQHHSRYKTTNLSEALQKAFGEDTILFGGQRDPTHEPITRVGVSAATRSRHTFLLSNYQRPQVASVGRPSYTFYRGETAEEELKVWEALRATSAAPRYFKSFYHKASGYTFYDGAITCNNPIFLAHTERKILWPEQHERDPDILLSIGTLWSDQHGSSSEVDNANPKGIFGVRQYVKNLFGIMMAAVHDDLDCEKTWSSFYDSLNISEGDGHRKKKYWRINPKIPNTPPALDSVSSMDELQEIARKYCSTSPEIKNVASTLIASLFYFQMKSASQSALSGFQTCEGKG
ncbi:acyl transferase/acyl hydrolase/lysophospholipase [Tuber indicum]|nr:acyl transferase/acyl hydrolase/lysophospholipase [Tuber indicum]